MKSKTRVTMVLMKLDPPTKKGRTNKRDKVEHDIENEGTYDVNEIWPTPPNKRKTKKRNNDDHEFETEGKNGVSEIGPPPRKKKKE